MRQSGVQVQVEGARNLPIDQQIVGVESDRIGKTEELHQAEDTVIRLKAVSGAVKKLEEIWKDEPSSIAALNLMQVHLATEVRIAESKKAPDAAKLGLAEMIRSFAALRSDLSMPRLLHHP